MINLHDFSSHQTEVSIGTSCMEFHRNCVLLCPGEVMRDQIMPQLRIFRLFAHAELSHSPVRRKRLSAACIRQPFSVFHCRLLL